MTAIAVVIRGGLKSDVIFIRGSFPPMCSGADPRLTMEK
jgi:hypothetical protein